MRAAAASGLDVSLYLSPDRALGETLGGLLPPHLPRVSQGPGTLTEKLAKGLADSPNGPVMFICTDAPDISPALLLRCHGKMLEVASAKTGGPAFGHVA